MGLALREFRATWLKCWLAIGVLLAPLAVVVADSPGQALQAVFGGIVCMGPLFAVIPALLIRAIVSVNETRQSQRRHDEVFDHLAQAHSGYGAGGSPYTGTGHIGLVGGQITVDAEVMDVETVWTGSRSASMAAPMPQQRTRHVLRAFSGHLVSWISNRPHGLVAGDLVSLTGEVKRHSMEGVEPLTEMFYCCVDRIPDAEAREYGLG